MEPDVNPDERATAPPSAAHCSLGSGGNWTDLVTNVTSLEPQRFTADFRAWLDWGTAPPDMLSLFLHEATHHSCFASPLGAALSGLALRARRSAVTLLESRSEEVEELLFDDLVRFETALTLLRPLAEGWRRLPSLTQFPKYGAEPSATSCGGRPYSTWTQQRWPPTCHASRPRSRWTWAFHKPLRACAGTSRRSIAKAVC